MTTEPQIKKYRRIVTKAEIEKGAEAILKKDGMIPVEIGRMFARVVLEAHAEVIEVKIIIGGKGAAYIYQKSDNDFTGFKQMRIKLEQFNAKWEEVI